MNNEVWKDVKGYEGYYEVSSYGNVRRLNSNKNLSPFTSVRYKRVLLSKDGIKQKHSVHRLMMIVFIENKHNKPMVNHIDNNGFNNVLSNLEWCTNSENQIHSYKCGISSKKGGKNNSAKIVLNIRNGVFYECISDCAFSLNMKPDTLRKHLTKKIKTYNFIKLV